MNSIKLKNRKDIIDFEEVFCKSNNLLKKINWYPNESKMNITKTTTRYRMGKSKRVDNCEYVIQLYSNENLIVVWKYRGNTNESYSAKTIKEKLSNGIYFADKGKEKHVNEQALVYFCYTENFAHVLKLIYGLC